MLKLISISLENWWKNEILEIIHINFLQQIADLPMIFIYKAENKIHSVKNVRIITWSRS